MIGYPLDSHVEFDENNIPVYDRAVTSAPLRKLIKKLFSDGIMPNVSTNMQVSAGTGLTVTVNRGFAICNGCLKLEEDKTQLKLDAGNTAYDRIDTVVLRLDDNDDVRSCEFAIIKGIPSANPVHSPVKRGESVWELGLATIRVPAGARAISNSNITDTRYQDGMCGVISALGELDSDGIYQQVQADLAEFKETEQAEFIQWFAQMKNQLSSDAAGNLQRQINVERARIDVLASLEDGSTSGDAELMDIRVGIDGTTYPTAGTAVRVQALELKDSTDRLNSIIASMPMKTVIGINDEDRMSGYVLSREKTTGLKVGDQWEGVKAYVDYPAPNTVYFKKIPGGRFFDISASDFFTSSSDMYGFGCMYVINASDTILDIVEYKELFERKIYFCDEPCTVYFSLSNVLPPNAETVYQILEFPSAEELDDLADYVAQQDLDGIAKYYVTEVSTSLKSDAVYENSAIATGLQIGSSWPGIDAKKEAREGYRIWQANALSSQIIDFTGSVLKDATLYVVTDGEVRDIVTYSDFTKEKTYKFETTSSKFTINADMDGVTAFVNFGEYNQSQHPNQAERTKIEIQNGSEAEVFRLKDISAAKYLHFHKNAAKLYFDRCSNPCTGADDFELYIRSESDAASPIKGYEKVTSLDAIKTGTKYLIASQGEDGNYYVMRPMLNGQNYEYVAKVITSDDESIGRLATAVANFDGEYVDLEKCLYSFDCDNMIYVSGACMDGSRESDLAFKIQKLEAFAEVKRRMNDLSRQKAKMKAVEEQIDPHRTVLYSGLGVQIDPSESKKYVVPLKEGPIRNILTQACSDAGTTPEILFDKLKMMVDFGGSNARQTAILQTFRPGTSELVIAPIAFFGDGVQIGTVQYDRNKYELTINVPDGCVIDTYYLELYLERL